MKTGILLTNIGSPDSPTVSDVRTYLKKFLSDPHVVRVPRWIWFPILFGYILPFRSRSSAKLYQNIWNEKGSPLTIFCLDIAEKLSAALNLPVEIGMQYSNPSIPSALKKLRDQSISKLIVLPLYPQYSTSTTQAAIDSVKQYLTSYPEIQANFVTDYADHTSYIEAIAESIELHWNQQGKPDHLLFSFHGLPKKFVDEGDPYEERCRLTANLVANKLGLSQNFWTLSFQSRLGKAKWLSPYTDKVLEELPSQGKKIIDVVCPGFSVDCLETLEEIAIRGKEQFEESGGKTLRYIPALNATPAQIHCIGELISKYY